jgi:RHS repeat-associated protein
VRTYDVHGNLTDDGAGKSFEWDAMGRLVAISSGTIGVESYRRSEFRYNAVGQRVQQREFTGTNTTPLVKNHLWAEGVQPVEERVQVGGFLETKRFYAHGYQHHTAAGTTNYFYTHDHLGSVREVVDASGAIRARYAYTPFGQRTKVQGDLDADFGFTGHYFHAASGLNLTLYRAYDSSIGRWLSRDPIGEKGGMNLYGYVGNDPISYVDPDGRFFLPALGFIALVSVVTVVVLQVSTQLTSLTLDDAEWSAASRINQDSINHLCNVINSGGEIPILGGKYGTWGSWGASYYGNSGQAVVNLYESSMNPRGYPSALAELTGRAATGIWNEKSEANATPGRRKAFAETLLIRHYHMQNFIDDRGMTRGF